MQLKPHGPTESTDPAGESTSKDAPPSREPSIEFEDYSDEAQATMELIAMLNWVRNQRARGNLPN